MTSVRESPQTPPPGQPRPAQADSAHPVVSDPSAPSVERLAVGGKLPKAPNADCFSCPLKEEPYVPTTGPVDAKVVLVGEAPGAMEVEKGEPFVGASGKLLASVLTHHRLDRGSLRITNVVLCRPPENRTPTKREIACCSKRLVEDTKRGQTLVTLGGTAASAIAGEKVKILSYRAGPPRALPTGQMHVPTVHPAACLRSSDLFPSLVTDLGKVLKNDVTVTWVPPDYRGFDSPASASAALRELLDRYTDIVIDIEVGFDKDMSFDHPDRSNLLCIGIGYAPGKAIVVGGSALQDSGVRSLLARLLREKRIIAHNGKFDLKGLKSIEPNAKLYFDTMLASYALDERPGTHGLKYLATELLGAPDYSAEVKRLLGRGSDYGGLPRDVLYRYNAYDVTCTYGLFQYFQPQLTGELKELNDFLTRASNALMRVELGGIRVDRNYLEQADREACDALEKLERELRRWVDNPRSPSQVKASLGDLGKPVESTDKDSLTKLLVHWDVEVRTFAETMLRYRKLHKTKSTYFDGLRKRLYRERVYPNFLLHGTTSGRLSCRNPNLQNLTRGSSVRNLFVPSPGNVFIQCDYKQAELRTVAALAKDPWLQGVFREGRDLHSEVAARFFGPNFTKEQRVKAKTVVFGLSYGMEAYSLSQHMKINASEARTYIKKFFEPIPNVVAWRESVKNQVLNEQEDLVTPFGRHRRFWLVTNENAKDVVKEGTAFLPQSIASDICLLALVKLVEKGVAVRVPVHDSILVESDSADAEDCKRMVQSTMERASETFTDFVPFPVDVAVGNRWGDL